jgi:hypothetical protein
MSSGGMRVVADTLRIMLFGTVDFAYLPIGSVFSHPIRLLNINNDTNEAILISYDGVSNNQYIPAQTGLVLDFTSNSGATVFPLMAAGTIIYAAGFTALPTSGVITVSAYYCIGD